MKLKRRLFKASAAELSKLRVRAAGFNHDIRTLWRDTQIAGIHKNSPCDIINYT